MGKESERCDKDNRRDMVVHSLSFPYHPFARGVIKGEPKAVGTFLSLLIAAARMARI